MILATASYVLGFGLAWWTVHAMLPWSALAWVAPLLWAVGLWRREPSVLRLALVIGFAVAAWSAWPQGSYLSVAGTVLLLWAWDVGMLALRLSLAGKVKERRTLWRAQLLRASGIAVIALILGFSLLHVRIRLPFWVLAGILLAAWLAVGWLHRQGAAFHGRGAVANGKRSSSSPPGTE